jgi:hypothetical protein
MSKTWVHYRGAAHHNERAAYHFKEAAKYHEAEELEKVAHQAYLAHGHTQHALVHDVEAAKLQAKKCDGREIPDSGPRVDEKNAA